VAQLNLRVALFRLLPESADAGRLVWRCYALALVTSLVLGGLVFGVGASIGAPWSAIPELATSAGVLLLVAGTAAWSIFNLQDGVLAGLRRTGWVPVENALYAIAKIGALVVLGGLIPAIGIVVSWIVPAIVLVCCVSVGLAWRWIPAHARSHAGRVVGMKRGHLLGFVAADTVGAWFALAATTLLPVMVVAVSGPQLGGYFAITWMIVTAIDQVPVNIAASLTVEAVHAGSDLGTQTRRTAIHMFRLVVPMVVLIVLFAPWILRVFGQEYETNATDLLRIAALGLLPLAANALFVAVARVRGEGRVILGAQATIATITLGGSALLLGPMGPAGVAIAWLVAQSLVALVVVPWRLWPLIGRHHDQ
jgi:O-antigen/teichoic acid export membrane protein